MFNQLVQLASSTQSHSRSEPKEEEEEEKRKCIHSNMFGMKVLHD